jgi:hypothetical protein
MNLWFRLTLVCCLLLCVFLSLPQAVGLNHRVQIVGFRACFDRGRGPASDPPAVSVVRRMRFDLLRAAPLACLLLDCAWAAANLGPPGSETHGPPKPIELGELPVKQSSRQLQPTPRADSSPRKLLTQKPILKNQGFTTAFI